MAKILVVDDQPANRELVTTLIRHRGHQPLEAADGAEALAVVRKERPELVISDILMPTMDGYEFVRRLRADAELAATEVVFYTAHYHEREARKLAEACGVSSVLIKPCEPEEILRTIDRALAHAGPFVEPSSGSEEFDREHLRLLSDKLSSKVADLEAANLRLSALTELNLHLASEYDPPTLLEQLCRGARELVGAKFSVLCARDKTNGELIYFTSGIDSALAERLKAGEAARGTLRNLLSVRPSARTTNLGADVAGDTLPSGYPSACATLVAPVVSLNRAYGWVLLADKLGADEFSADDERMLLILAAQTGRVYENGSLYAQVRQQAEQLRLEINERKQAAELLHASEQRFRQMAENISDVFFLRDAASLRLLYISPAYESVWGRSPESLYADPKSWVDSIHPDDRAATRALLEQGLLTGEFRVEYRILRPDGAVRHIESRGYPVRDRNGTIVRIAGVAKDVTEPRHVERMLQENRQRLNGIVSSAMDGIVTVDDENRIVLANAAAATMFGYKVGELLGQSLGMLLPERYRSVHLNHMQGFAKANISQRPMGVGRSVWGLRRNGEEFPIDASISKDASTGRTLFTAILRDITERVRSEERIRRLNRVYAVLSGINTLIVRVQDRDELYREACRIAVEDGQFRAALISSVGEGARSIVEVAFAGVRPALLDAFRDGYPLDEDSPVRGSITARAVREKRPRIINDVRSIPQTPLAQECIEFGILSGAILPLVVSGQVVGVVTLMAAEVDYFDDEEMKLLMELAGDIAFAVDTIDKRAQLDYLAFYDPITGLANRTLFTERLNQGLQTAARESKRVALLLGDIKRFRQINESIGRAGADDLLKQIAQRVRGAVLYPDNLTRLHGNCFGTFIPGLDDAAIAHRIALLLRETLRAPFVVNGQHITVEAVIGAAIFPEDGTEAEVLLTNAEAVLKKAKNAGEEFLLYEPTINARVAESFKLEHKLRQAIELEQFVLFYQPKVDMARGPLRSVEALIRWNDPETGLVPPGRFIPLLEETGLIKQVGIWAMRKAVSDVLHWKEMGLNPPRCAVNVSAIQLRDKDFAATVIDALAQFGDLEPLLDIELTESLIMENVAQTITTLQTLRGVGVEMAIDDFGTGYSSLAYLSRLPVNLLKIDRSFIQNLGARGLDTGIVASIISLAHSLKLKVVAEGVETAEQAEILRSLNCDQMQGFLFSKPVPAEQIESMLRNGPAWL